MSNITTAGSTSYPGVLDTRTILTDGPSGDDIVAAHPNGLSAAVIALETELGVDPAGTLPDLVTRLAVSQNTDGTIKSTVVAAGTGATIDYTAGVFTVGSTPDGPSNTQNVGLVVNMNSPVSNAFTVRLVQRTLSTCTSASPARISFRESIPYSGGYAIVTATDNVSLTASVGSTLGFTDGEYGRIYFYAINANPGAANSVVELAMSKKAIFQEHKMYNTTAEGAAGAADSDSTLYSTTARGNVPVRCIGFIDILTGTTAGNWSNTPDVVHLMGPGTKRTGDIVQIITTQSNVYKTGTTVIPNDTTVPTSAEGDMYLWASISATSAVNRLIVEGLTMMTNSNASSPTLITALFYASESNARQTTAMKFDGTTGTGPSSIPFMYEDLATTTATRMWYVRAGGSGAGTTYYNGNNSAVVFATATKSWLRITEVMA